MHSKYPNSIYRVSLKAIIHNDKNEVLLVKENSDSWNLPGGGLNHGETPEEGLKRELYEEALITSPFKANLIGTEIMYIPTKEAWQIWLVYKVTLDQLTFSVGKDADEVAFLDPTQFKGSESRSEQLVYKWTVEANS